MAGGLTLALALAGTTPPVLADDPTPEPIPIKIATLAPEGTAWIKLLRTSTREIADKLDGRVKFTIYGGGVQGDEKVAVQKIKTGQLQGAGVTVIGLSTIAPDMTALNLPMMFTSKEQLTATREAMKSYFAEKLWESGYKIAIWGDVGFFYLFSSHPIRHPDDLKKGRVWVWNADPVFNQMALESGAAPIPLGIADVLSALNTGQVDTVLMNPFALVSLQWYTKMKYRMSEPILFSIGGLLIARGVWEQLTPEEQEIFLAVYAKWAQVADRKSDRDNARAIQFLDTQAVEVVTPSPSDLTAWDGLSRKTWDRLAGRAYSHEVLAELLRYRDEYGAGATPEPVIQK